MASFIRKVLGQTRKRRYEIGDYVSHSQRVEHARAALSRAAALRAMLAEMQARSTRQLCIKITNEQ